MASGEVEKKIKKTGEPIKAMQQARHGPDRVACAM